jgi:hypothetical protein
MTRNLKVLGLALVAAFAMSALVASAASATAWQFHSNTDNPVLTGSQEGTDVFTTDSGTVRCSEANYTGSATGTTNSTIEVAPTYEGCKLLFIINVTVDPNGCKYLFHAETTTNTGGTPAVIHYEGSVDIVCTGGNVIVVTAPGCDITVPAQTGLKTVTFTNLGSGHTQEVTVDVNISNTITYIEHQTPGETCENSGTPHTTNGSYTGQALVTGEDASKNHIGIWVA